MSDGARDDDEFAYRVGYGYALIVAGAGLVLFAMLYAVLNEPIRDLQSYAANRTSSDAAAAGQSVIIDGWELLPLWALGIFIMYLFIRAVVERE